ncbi:hypothetical protein [Fodinibius halophilus]|uniref:Uncharacterized protein n=1 Tax=Fodinibius halophilus TaxID=1736908 RepID=A0A6M1T847_9BACT|nr:hypothetical protein [Fodinibius halophilus]NGP89625.1 hypothetical protein [Fodinibius halophilus]
MDRLKYIQVQLKIMNRYLNLTIGLVLFYILSGIILVDFSRSYAINIPLISVALAISFTGGLFGRLFCEKKNEIQGYMLTPWFLRSVILSKNIALLLLSAAVPLPMLVAASFFVPIAAQDYIDMALYFITSISVCLLLGNVVSISKNIMSSERLGFSPLQWLIVAVSPVPYLIFKSWMGSWTLCVLFFCVSCFVWYFYELPWAERNFQTVFYKIS